jgi:ABC-type polar amino acid transport system ATPase subunit
MIVAKNINKAFDKRRTLIDFSASLAPGEITALIGPSGSGKSTFLRALSLLDPPDDGVITIDDVTHTFPLSSDIPFVSPWPNLTIVFQQLFLWPHLTVRENILLPLQRNGEKAMNGTLDELADLFNMREFLDRYPNQVSIGQRQRAALARALALKPKYLLLDEITSALDVEYVAVMLEHLKQLRDAGTGILLVTHFIEFAKAAADRVLFIAEGRLAEMGGPEILSNPKTDRLAKFLSIVHTAR